VGQVLLLSLLFTGYLVNIAAVTPVLQWVHYLSVFFYGFESLIVNEMSGISLIFAVCVRPSLQPSAAYRSRWLGRHMGSG
jgi:ABC-type multidrug transport system permease subunit